MQMQTYDEINNAMRNYIIANCDKISDFNDGSIISSFTEAVARVVLMLYIRCKVGYSTHLSNLPYSIFDFSKKPGKKSTGKVVFSRSSVIGYATTIPNGTIISAGSLRYYTTEAGKIGANQVLSSEIPVQAEFVGAIYNVKENSIQTIDSVLTSDVVSVTNTAATLGGSNEESQSEYQTRFKEYILGLQKTNYYGLRSTLLELDSVRSCSIIEHFPPIDNIFNFTVYADDGNGTCSDILKSEIKKTIDGTEDRTNPGCKAVGLNYRVLAPTIIPISIDVTISVYNYDSFLAVFEAQEAVKNYINNLLVGEKVVLTTIILLLRRKSYIKDVEILFPSGNVSVTDIQIARYENCTVNIIEV